MNDPRKTTIDGRKAAPDPSAGDDEAQVSSERVLEVLAQIAQGDLSVLTNGQLALAESDRHLLLNLDGLARRLRYIVGRLQRAADSIETVVGEVLRGTQMLSAGVLDEAKSVEETSRSIAEINASMHSVGDSLQTLSNLSQSTSNSVMRMATSINQVSENADELAQFVEETAFAIEDMANTVRKVADSTEALAES